MDKTSTFSSGIGDISSSTRGSGARYNGGKTPIELIPLRMIAEQRARADGEITPAVGALFALARFQEGGGARDLLDAISQIGPAWNECAVVFDYGRAKYASWNWAKGMNWSVPLACAARHLVFGILAGEEKDQESGHPHRGHFLCNIVMLLTFMRTYPEGDDRPKEWLGPLLGLAEHAALEDDARLIAASNANA